MISSHLHTPDPIHFSRVRAKQQIPPRLIAQSEQRTIEIKFLENRKISKNIRMEKYWKDKEIKANESWAKLK